MQSLTPDMFVMLDAIARYGSFARAAQALDKAPSSVTYSVRKLEDDLDVLLFDRRGPHATLTAAGRALRARYAPERMCAAYEALLSA